MNIKSMLVIAATVVLGVSAYGQGTTKTKTTIHCAVMASNSVDIAAATKAGKYADYKGKRYFFCCDGCPQAFKKDPAKYAKSESIPTPKAKKK